MPKLIQHIRLTPNAKRSGIVGKCGEQIKVAVTAPPLEGRANEALRELLAAEYGVPKSRIRIIRGLTGRNKTVEIDRP
ncbi:MAG: DUF167 domain-containing protein [Rickettsiales bacterium]|jgi:uncharacterized protein (TIGR00251 family)|nr:DUF167 domain-containing protein [Rickettsiales bacterium]